MLSKDQTEVVVGVIGKAPVKEWTNIVPPVGKQDMPDWLQGLHIDWMMQYANSPHLVFKAAYWPMPEEVLWQQGPKGRWFREYEGIMEQIWNDGALTHMDNGEWETAKTSGSGGRTSTLRMLDGRVVHVRGSWYGRTPEGYSEMSVVDIGCKYVKLDQRSGKHSFESFSGKVVRKNLKPRAWFKCGAVFGLYVPDDLLIKALAKYQPHVGIARVPLLSKDHHGDRIEPYLLEWEAPKRLRAK